MLNIIIWNYLTTLAFVITQKTKENKLKEKIIKTNKSE